MPTSAFPPTVIEGREHVLAESSAELGREEIQQAFYYAAHLRVCSGK